MTIHRVLLGASLWVAACAGDLTLSSTDEAIRNGTLDGYGHPYVGTIGIQQASGAWIRKCTGSLISPTVFLTAGHCIINNGLLARPHGSFGVSFDPDFSAPDRTLVFATAYLHPLWGAPGGQAGGVYAGPTNDVAVLVLDTAVSDHGFAALPPHDLLGSMNVQPGGLRDQQFTNVGYGITDADQGGRDRTTDGGIRRVSTSSFMALTDEILMLSLVVQLGNGGVCYGDSGGPQLLEGTNTIGSISHGGDPDCQTVHAAQRVDTDVIRDFLAGFVALP